MKKSFLVMGILAICITSISQELQHKAVAVNIEVPVRVFNEVAKATGGLTYASGNPLAAFKRTADASEN